MHSPALPPPSMGSKRELEADHDVQPVGKKRKKAHTFASASPCVNRVMHEAHHRARVTQVKAMMAAAQVAIAEVSAVRRLSLSCFHMLQSHHVAHAQHADAHLCPCRFLQS